MPLLIPSNLTLLTSLLIHFFIITTNNWILHILASDLKISWTVAQGISYILYPIFGWIADIRVTYYRMINMSFVIVLVSSLFMFALAIINYFRHDITEHMFLTRLFDIIFPAIILIVGMIGFGMYEANAIQFGMDQMLEASSEQLSSFIYWYYWSLHVGTLTIFYVLLALLYYIYKLCKIELNVHKQNDIIFGWLLLVPSVIQITLIILGLFFMRISKKHIYTNPVRSNPFKLIFNVIKYSWKHKYPVSRSAFTYWENDIPSRINFGKSKYGGPFTNEQVEDVKTLLQLLLLIISLFGFQLSGDGNSLSEYMMYNLGCPTRSTMLLLVMNPEHVTFLVILLGIPLYQFIIKKRCAKYTPIILKRVHVGLFLCLIREGIYPIVSLLMSSKDNISTCYFNELYEFTNQNSSLTTLCLLANTKAVVNGTCERVCPHLPVQNHLFLLILIPQILHGLAYLLVFMTVLEFICAQAPYTMKGLLIGIWYSTLSIKYLVVNVLDGYLIEETTWNIYHGVKGFFIFLSILLFCFVYKFYHYRERDEIVNEQTIIEEQYERELLHHRDEEFENSEICIGELTQLLHIQKH